MKCYPVMSRTVMELMLKIATVMVTLGRKGFCSYKLSTERDARVPNYLETYLNGDSDTLLKE